MSVFTLAIGIVVAGSGDHPGFCRRTAASRPPSAPAAHRHGV